MLLQFVVTMFYYVLMLLKFVVTMFYYVLVLLQFVVTMFWALYLYDRDLVYPRLLDSFIPQWLNHGMVSTMLLFVY